MSTLIAPTVYVWVTPAFVSGAPVDHTWITTYDNRITVLPNVDSVVALEERYWFCWGSFHTNGNPAAPLRLGPVDIPFADCLVKPNADSRDDKAARGTIFKYGTDGVCHQLANQVLWATKDSLGAPLTTAGAKSVMRVRLDLFGFAQAWPSLWQRARPSPRERFGIKGATH